VRETQLPDERWTRSSESGTGVVVFFTAANSDGGGHVHPDRQGADLTIDYGRTVDPVRLGTLIDGGPSSATSLAPGHCAEKGASAVIVRITPNDKGNPPGKLADAELHFTEGPLAGLRLIGFAIWERRGGGVGRNVTFPARNYSVNGERRSYALLRPIVDSTSQNAIRDLVLEAFQEYEERAAIAS
jgi:hypothetical protein